MSELLTILTGDVLYHLRSLPNETVQCCVTSPPYWGLRDYGVSGQLGLEKTPDEYVAKIVEVFREVRRVLKKDGTLWLNLGDTYHQGNKGQSGEITDPNCKQATNAGSQTTRRGETLGPNRTQKLNGIKAKDLVGIPWMVAFALREPYVDWQIKTEAMRAWTAGIVDGEGCITILQTKSSHSESLSFPPVVQVRMSDRQALDRLVEVVGSKIGKEQLPPSHVAANQRSNWQWKIVSEQAARVIAEIYPFLTIKRKQAIVAWNHQQFRASRGNQERKGDDLAKEEFCKRLINSLNQREAVDIPSWMQEPTVKIEPGWYLRQDCIWSKPNPMPESVTDRCTKAHEYLFLLTKSPRYYYDQDAILEPCSPNTNMRISQDLANQIGSHRANGGAKTNGPMKAVQRKAALGEVGVVKSNPSFEAACCMPVIERNKRSVWTVNSYPFSDAHFATYPPDLIKPCILAGTKPGDVVLDPFAGSGTTGMVALELGRKALLIELNPEYVKLIERRCNVTTGLAL